MEFQEQSKLLNPSDATGSQWDVVLIKGGFNSSKQRYYTSEALTSIANLAEAGKLQCMANHMTNSQSREMPEGSVLNVIGWFTEVKHNVAANQVEGKLNLLTEGAPYPHLPKAMLEAHSRGLTNLFDLSIRGYGEAKRGTIEGQRTNVISKLDGLVSTDLVTMGGAGGEVVNVLASERNNLIGEDTNMKLSEVLKDYASEDIEEALKESHPEVAQKFADAREAGESVATVLLDDSEKTAVTETMSQKVVTEIETPESTELTESKQVLADIRSERFAMQAETLITSNPDDLPKNLLERLSTKVGAGVFSTVDQVKAAMAEYKEDFAGVVAVTTSGIAVPSMRDFSVDGETKLNEGLGIDQIYKGMVGLVSGKPDFDGVKSFLSLKEAYWHYKQFKGEPVHNAFTGMSVAEQIIRESATGFDPIMFQNVNEAMAGGTLIEESITSTSFSTLLGTSMHKVFIDAYANLTPLYQDHRRVMSRFQVVGDFKNHEFTRRGVYNTLPAVAQGGTYQPVTSPAEENVTMAVTKFGGLEDLTIESIANDDLNALQSIPRDLATAAIVARYRAVFDLLAGNQGDAGADLDYDSVTLINSSHNNNQTARLTTSTLSIAKRQMMAQAALSASEVLIMVSPKFLLVAPELERVAKTIMESDFEVSTVVDRTVTATNAISNVNVLKGLAEVIVIPYWTTRMTSGNNESWYLVADPNMWDTWGMLVLQGHEEPQLTMQEDPSQGSMFTADKTTVKVRDIRDQDLLDHRSFAGSDVA